MVTEQLEGVIGMKGYHITLTPPSMDIYISSMSRSVIAVDLVQDEDYGVAGIG